MKAILLDEAKKWLEENCENQYTRMAVFGIMQSMPTVDYQKTPNEPLTQADLDSMDYDKVWLDYGGDGEWALVVSGRIYALAVLEGAGFEDILRYEVDGETMDRPSGNYTVYRCPPEGEVNERK